MKRLADSVKIAATGTLVISVIGAVVGILIIRGAILELSEALRQRGPGNGQKPSCDNGKGVSNLSGHPKKPDSKT
jgi:hypothetical protein